MSPRRRAGAAGGSVPSSEVRWFTSRGPPALPPPPVHAGPCCTLRNYVIILCMHSTECLKKKGDLVEIATIPLKSLRNGKSLDVLENSA